MKLILNGYHNFTLLLVIYGKYRLNPLIKRNLIPDPSHLIEKGSNDFDFKMMWICWQSFKIFDLSTI